MISDRYIQDILKLAKNDEMNMLRVYLNGLVAIGVLELWQGKNLYDFYRNRSGTFYIVNEVWRLLDQFRLMGIEYNENVRIFHRVFTKGKDIITLCKYRTIAGYSWRDWGNDTKKEFSDQ